jgi:hypothetical protein
MRASITEAAPGCNRLAKTGQCANFGEEVAVAEPIQLSADLLVEEALRLRPRLAALLLERGVVCLRCGEPVWGTLGETIARKGLPVAELLAELEAELAR